MNSKRGLGRGLGALLSSTPTDADTLLEVEIDQVEPNPHQPRKVFDSNALNELSASIRASGVIQPVIVLRQGAGYQLVAGERRWRAARQAGLPRLPAVVREVAAPRSPGRAPRGKLPRGAPNPGRPAAAAQAAPALGRAGRAGGRAAARADDARANRRRRAPGADRGQLCQRRGARATDGIARRATLSNVSAERIVVGMSGGVDS